MARPICPGMVASLTTLPVIGVPVPLKLPRRAGLAAVDRADAGRGTGGDRLDRRRAQRRPARGAHSGHRPTRSSPPGSLRSRPSLLRPPTARTPLSRNGFVRFRNETAPAAAPASPPHGGCPGRGRRDRPRAGRPRRCHPPGRCAHGVAVRRRHARGRRPSGPARHDALPARPARRRRRSCSRTVSVATRPISTPRPETWLEHGYVVLTYTARGFGKSGGLIHLDAPAYEVADALEAGRLPRYPSVGARRTATGDPQGRGGRLVLRRRAGAAARRDRPADRRGGRRHHLEQPAAGAVPERGRRPDRACSRSSGPATCSRPRTAARADRSELRAGSRRTSARPTSARRKAVLPTPP